MSRARPAWCSSGARRRRAPGRRRPAPRPGGPSMVKGRRITTVDMHAHCAVPKAVELLRRPAANQGSDDPLMLDGQALAQRLAVMDAQRIDVSVLSINPNWYDVARDLATRGHHRAEREPGRVLREPYGSLRGVRLGRAAVSGSGRPAARARHEDSSGCAVWPSAAVWPGRNLPIRCFIRSGRRRRNSGAVVFIHPQPAWRPTCANRLKGQRPADQRDLATRSRRRSRCRT